MSPQPKDPKDAKETKGSKAKATPKKATKPSGETSKAAKGEDKSKSKATKPDAKTTSKTTAKAETKRGTTKKESAKSAGQSSKAAAGKKTTQKSKASTPAGDEKAESPKKATPSKPRQSRKDESRPGVVVNATARYVRTSARKARLVCDNIRDKDVEQARAILAFTPRHAAKAWKKLLESAIANAEDVHGLSDEQLRVASVYADEGPTLKRFRPRAMGRATPILKRTAHLTIKLTAKD